MPAPYDYTIDVESPFEAAVSGLKLGAAAAEARAKGEAAKAQQSMTAELQGLFKNPNPTASDFARVSAMLPKDAAENVRKSWDMLNAEQQSNRISQAGQIYSALNAGATDIAENLLTEQAAAYRNAGNERDAKAAETYIELIKFNPASAKTNIGLMLAQIPGGDKVIESATKLGVERRAEEKSPAELTEAQAKAQSAAVAANFAEANAVVELQKKGWDITKIQNDIDISKQNSKIAAINSQIAREDNELKKRELQLKVQDMEQKRDSMVREKSADFEAASANIDNMLNTADRILATPMDVIGSAAGPVSSRMPTISQATADFEELVNTLGSQAFLAQIPNIKGLGNLSNAEGEKLTAALQSFSLRQSPERLVENVKEAQRLLLKARKNVSARAGIPENIPDTPAANSAATGADIDALVKKYTQGRQ